MKSPLRLLALVLTLSLATTLNGCSPSIDQLIKQGADAQKIKNYSQAEAIYRKIIQREPNNAKAYYKLCDVLNAQNKLDDAVAACQKSITFNTNDAQTYYVLGIVLKKQKKLEEALKSYRRAIELDPKFASPHAGVGLLLKEQGKLEEAISKYRQALSLPEDKLTTPASAHTLTHNYLGLTLQQQGNLEQAIEEYKKALQIDPNFIYTSNNLKEAERLLTLRRNPQAEAMDDRQYLPKNEPSFPILRPVVLIIAEFSSGDKLGPENGTGLVIQRDGNRTLIITNRHVIFDEKTRKQGQNIQVEFFSEPPSGKLRMRRNARVLGMTPPTDNLDIAVLEVTDPLPDDIKPLPTSSNPLQRQMSVRAIGHPLRGIPWSIEPGTISSYNSQQLQISGTAIQAGNSGGPVINSENQLLGIVVEVDEGLGFAYPMPVIMEKLRALGIK